MNIFESWIATTPIASRGLYNNEDVPENSLLSVKKAMDKNYAVHVEVRALLDNTIVTFHDETLGRMTGTDGFISNCNKEDIENLKLLKSEEHIPTLQEVLDCVNGKVPILVEIKNLENTSYEKHVWQILKNYKGEYAVCSINPTSLEWFKLNAPIVKRGQISSFFKKSNIPFRKRHAYKRLKLMNVSEPNFIIYKCEDLPNRFVKKYKDLPLIAYHVKCEDSYKKIKKHVCNVVFDSFEI